MTEASSKKGDRQQNLSTKRKEKWEIGEKIQKENAFPTSIWGGSAGEDVRPARSRQQ